ncbi:hypothetical protein RHODGE_RHODGE_03379 [Rhodoplanes serenus]|uniref:Uncharacterized protein n=2 Tax=Nitrobacteraceae TaxID=41294 RepID=A0A3S4B668_9BRAD|nr:hypothetical protein RHODGE_RHODGE_03379 [Rhodoplanes serenus]
MLPRPPRVRTTPACTPVDLARPARRPLSVTNTDEKAAKATMSPQTCKAHIMAANDGPPGAVDPTAWGCRAPDSLYGLERPFMKRSLVEPDRELMGRGP